MRDLTVDVEDVRFRYAAQPVLDGATFKASAGEFVIVSGMNGSGKSTLLRLCVGLLVPERGDVRVLGGSATSRQIRRRIGYAPQGSRAVTSLPVSVREVVIAGLTPKRGLLAHLLRDDRRRVEATMEAVGLANLASECLFELSGGQQQRAILARTLVSDPDLILLDEPTTGIDPRFRPALLEELGRRANAGATVLAVSHDPDDFREIATRSVVVEEGKIFERQAVG
jgi:ABC-type Mn2+/Zn2+ transport system ATPase subunit